MSQIYKRQSGGPSPIPPEVATSYVTDDGTAVPAGYVLNVLGLSTIDNNPNGIQTYAIPDLSNNLFCALTNSAFGTVETTTTGQSPALSLAVTSISPALPAGVLKLNVDVLAWIDDTLTGSTWHLEGAMKYDGAGGLATIGSPIRTVSGENPPFDVTQVTVGFSGPNISVLVDGLAMTTINWTAFLSYQFGGAS